ncbi:FtsW/RodA/SpoVE family cell cycle protein [Pseudoflavonifractor phocaeensis]|uniref:FtsW/RodA/SpoVE family cell cycle protein n=1 Tax=Pseudoflavonifractor phocaeensis TaxID=1870988 RepID=UPI00195B58BA|nr:FtsW/RodA/SpoVE family cell cycle protein [Pseudoflavonifractor phocaeensis]MBM6869019.1 FtsW/RodA/SpoVE family cell cycle protein [Pseudoflavonifractor phocaeensis]
MDGVFSAFQPLMDQFTAALGQYPMVWAWYTAIVRFIFPILAVGILAGAIRSMLRVTHVPEVWAYLTLPNGGEEPLTHWENILGRSGASDVVLNYPVVSRQHAALIRGEDESWTVHDLDSKGGVTVNGKAVAGKARVDYGDVIGLGGVETVLLSVSPEEEAERRRRRQAEERPASPWGALVLLTLFQVLTAIQLIVSEGAEASAVIPMTFLCLTGLMWVYFLVLRAARRVGFEMEIIAFFLSTLSLAVTSSSNTAALFKQFLALVLGLILFLVLGIFMRNLGRVQRIRWLMAGAAVFLLLLSCLFGAVNHGATNWISIGGFSFQPSEIAKICYIFAGAATLERLFRKRNLGLFMVLTGASLLCLAYMSDFGTAAIFFVTFLVIAYLRSGDWATLALICGGAVFGVFVILSMKPYILRRFASWGKAWQTTTEGSGFQQSRTMSAAASGGLVGVGPGNGWLHNVGAGDTDLVFGMLCEEWGLIIALLAVLCVITLAVFAVRSCRAGRSSFYVIAACAATSLLVFQTSLNVLGAVDILPLTGVTFPFVSNGGSAMMAAWGLLAYLKATDTRQNASFAIRLPSRKDRKKGEELSRRREPPLT